VPEEEQFDQAAWDELDADTQAEAIVDASFERVAELGLDENRVAETMNAIAQTGADPITSLALAVESHDMSGLDEMGALQKISEREGWD
jgi:hypothetical protein